MKAVSSKELVEIYFNGAIIEKTREDMELISSKHSEWTALDILESPEFTNSDKIRMTLRKDLIDASILHEFACRCAEHILSLISDPEKILVDLIAAKRKWMADPSFGFELQELREKAQKRISNYRSDEWTRRQVIVWASETSPSFAALRAASLRSLQEHSVAVLKGLLLENMG